MTLMSQEEEFLIRVMCVPVSAMLIMEHQYHMKFNPYFKLISEKETHFFKDEHFLKNLENCKIFPAS